MKDLEEHKEYLKIVLASTMTLEEKLNELGHIASEELSLLLALCEADEEYEICHAIETELKNRKAI